MNNSIRELNGFCNVRILYGDTDSLFSERNYWDVLDKADLVGTSLCHGKNDYKSGRIFYSFFLPLRTKYCLTINEFVIKEEQKTFKRFNDSKRRFRSLLNF